VHKRTHGREHGKCRGHLPRAGTFSPPHSSRTFTSRFPSALRSFRTKTDGKIMTEANIQLDEVDSPGTTLV
jgi:hypothetical protein